MWEAIKYFFNYPLIDWWSEEILASEGIEAVPSEVIFKFSFLNIILIVAIFLAAKIFIKYIKRYFKALHLTEKQLKIEGKEIAIWRLAKQFIYLLTFYVCFLSLKVSNPQLDLGNILGYDFIKFKNFHIAVYHIFLTVAIIFIARITVNFIKLFLLKTVRQNSKMDSGTQYVYVQLAKYLVYSIAIIIFLRSLGVDLDLFLTATTFLLVGAGLGLQSILKDYFSGFLLLFEGIIKVGDILEIETMTGSENFVAKVVQINLRTSKVETRNEKILVIPNSKLTHESVINWSSNSSLTRFTIPITFHYGVDTELVRNILIESALQQKLVSKKKKPFVRLLGFGLYGLDMDLVFWAHQSIYIDTLKSEIRFEIDKQLRIYNVEVPYPQTDVHINPRMNGEDFLKKDTNP